MLICSMMRCFSFLLQVLCACVVVIVSVLRGLVQGLGEWGGFMSVCVVSVDSLWRWKVHVSVYCARRIPAHLRCTQCSILLHLIDICFLTCLWQISQIQTFLSVFVGPGLISTSPEFMRSSANHPAGPHGRLVQKTSCTG